MQNKGCLCLNGIAEEANASKRCVASFFVAYPPECIDFSSTGGHYESEFDFGKRNGF